MSAGEWRAPFPFGEPEEEGRSGTVGATFQAAPREEQDRIAVPVLKAAWALVSKGWCRGFACAADGRPARFNENATSWSLVAAINSSGGDDLHIEYARRLLKRTLHEHDLSAWNDFPTRTRRQVLDLLERVIKGNQPKRRGGPYWSQGPGGVR